MAETELKLRAVEMKDCPLICKYENDTSVWQDSVTTRFYSEYAVEQYVRTSQNDDALISGQVRMMIDVTDSNGTLTVGCADLYEIDARHSRAGVGIYIDKAFRHNHYAQQAVIQITDYAFKILNLHQLYAFVSAENVPCNHVFSSCGFDLTSCLKDWLQYNNRYANANVYQKICK